MLHFACIIICFYSTCILIMFSSTDVKLWSFVISSVCVAGIIIGPFCFSTQNKSPCTGTAGCCLFGAWGPWDYFGCLWELQGGEGYLSVPSCVLLGRCWEGRQRRTAEFVYGIQWLDGYRWRESIVQGRWMGETMCVSRTRDKGTSVSRYFAAPLQE